MKYIITDKQYNLLMESSEEENLFKIPDFSFFGYDWEILQAVLKRKGNPRYYVDGNLNLQNSGIESLGNLVGVEGNLNLYKSKIESLENLEFVGGYLVLNSSNIKSLGNLEYVGGNLHSDSSRIESLGNLKYVGGDLNLGNTLIPRITTKEEIKSKINVVGNIYFA
jgi:hypothetical protein